MTSGRPLPGIRPLLSILLSVVYNDRGWFATCSPYRCPSTTFRSGVSGGGGPLDEPGPLGPQDLLFAFIRCDVLCAGSRWLGADREFVRPVSMRGGQGSRESGALQRSAAHPQE